VKFKDIRPESLTGEWVRFPDDTSDAELLIRPLPDSKSNEIDLKHYPRRQKVRMTKGDEPLQEVELDRIAFRKASYEKAAFALVDSRGIEIEVGDDPAARFYSRITKETANVGDAISLDGKWLPEIKDRIFNDFEQVFVPFILEKSTKMAEEEAAKNAALSKRTEGVG
jgi:hypothetical protein